MKTHIVYLITLKEEISGFRKYIGSKSNAVICGGKIISNGKEYLTSSKSLKPILSSGVEYEATELYSSSDYNLVLKEEFDLQKIYNVVKDKEYFNSSFASQSNFTNPGFISVKNKAGNKFRISKDDERFISRELVGVTSGTKYSEERKKEISESITGEKNPFYNKRHTEEVKKTISIKIKERGDRRSPEAVAQWIENVAKKAKSKEHRKKIGRPGFVMLKNIITGECLRVKKEEASNYDSNWQNPAVTQKRIRCIYCGKESVAGMITRWHNENCKEKDSQTNQNSI